MSVGSALGRFQEGKRVLKKNQTQNNWKYFYFCMFPSVFRTVEQFPKGARLQPSVDLWSSRVLVYSFRNLWIVDLCNIDLCLWNLKDVGEAMNFMVILQGGLNFIIQVSLWMHITSLGCRRQTF